VEFKVHVGTFHLNTVSSVTSGTFKLGNKVKKVSELKDIGIKLHSRQRLNFCVLSKCAYSANC